MDRRSSGEERLILGCIEDISNNKDKTPRGCRIRSSKYAALCLWVNVS
jgi:hypothetical protein